MTAIRREDTRPTVFLSYSSRDAALITRLDRDLQVAGLTVWRDEHEITPGESIRQSIFGEALTKCDHVVVYVTHNSIASPWVRQELDAAAVINIERDGGFLSLFVESPTIRQRLSADLRALNSPVLTEDTYDVCIRWIISNAWRGLLLQPVSAKNSYPEVIEQAISEQLLTRNFFKSNVIFDITVQRVVEGAALFLTEFSYDVTNRTEAPHHWYIGKRLRRPTAVCEVFFNGLARDAQGLDNRDARGLRVPCFMEAGETGHVLVRVQEEMRVPDSELYTSYNPATDLAVRATFPEELIAFDVEQLYLTTVQPTRGRGTLNVQMSRGILPYQGLRLNWRRIG